jgi:hypothetical protein
MTQEGQGLQPGITGCFTHSLHANRYLAAAARLLVLIVGYIQDYTLTLMVRHVGSSWVGSASVLLFPRTFISFAPYHLKNKREGFA